MVVFFALVFGVIFNYFFYFDKENNCRISIMPSLEFSNSNIIRAIKIIKNASAADYKNLCSNVNTINTSISCGGWQGGCYNNGESGKISVSTSGRSITQTVVVIVHETCHAMQDNEKRAFSEDECYKEGNRILKSIVEF